MNVPHRGARGTRSRARCVRWATTVKEEIAPRKRAGCQLLRGTCECASQVIVWAGVLSRKARTAAAQDGGDLGSGRSTEEQFLSDPFIGDAPVGLWEEFENPQAVQPIGIDVGCTSDCGGSRQSVGASRTVRGLRHRDVGHPRPVGVITKTMFGRFQQRGTLGSQAGVGVQHLHPRRVAAPVASLWFFISESGQAAQMTPIAAGQVATVEVGQLFADLSGNSSFDRAAADLDPSLEIVRTSLKYHAGFVTSGPHGLDDGWVAVIQVNEDVAGIAPLCIGMDVHVAAFPVADAQEPDGGRMNQLGSGPQPLSGEGPSGVGMNETDKIEVVRHSRELASDGLQSEIESEVEHGPNFGTERTRRTINSQRTENSGLTGCLSRGVHRRTAKKTIRWLWKNS
jgi:hypothetical protein